MRKIINIKKTILLFSVLIFLVTGCTGKYTGSNESQVAIKATLSENTKFGSANVSLSQEEFEKAGFTLGDSCDIVFGNGLELYGVPYYNGYYVKNGYPVIVAYPGDSNLIITYNNTGIWKEEELSNGETVEIILHKKGGYKATQEALGQVYSFKREDYKSDEQFCNYRELSGGKLKSDILYRGASPVDNSRGRAKYTDGLIEKQQIICVLDLADNEEDIAFYMAKDDFASPYAEKLLVEDRFVLLDMGSNFESKTYQKKVATGMKQLLVQGTPAYIHCMEGKDRTGFVCMLIEALCGASYDEMLIDYMKTYENYFGITKDGTPDRYKAVQELYFDSFMEYLHGTDDIEELKSADYSDDAARYLMNGGLTVEEVTNLKKMLME